MLDAGRCIFVGSDVLINIFHVFLLFARVAGWILGLERGRNADEGATRRGEAA